MKAVFVLFHQMARERALEAVRTAPEGFAVTVGDATRNLEQNAAIHALLTDVGASINWLWCGQRVDIEDLKSIFVAAFRKATGTPTRFAIGLDGQPVVLNWRTRDFGKREASEFLDFVGAWMSEREAA